MTVPDKLEIIGPDGAITFYTLNPTTGLTHIGRHPDNDVVLNQPTVADFQAGLHHDYKPYRLVVLGQQGETKLGGQSLLPGTPVVLQNGDVIELGPYRLILLEAEQTQPQADVVLFPNLPPLRLPPLEPLDEVIKLHLSASEWAVEVGQTAICEVTLANSGEQTVTLALAVLGGRPGWCTISTPYLTVRPGAWEKVLIHLTPPHQPTSLAGVHYLTLSLTSPDDPTWHNQQRLALQIAPYYEVRVGPIFPRRQTLRWVRSFGQAYLPLVNRSNVLLPFLVSGQDEWEHCHFEFEIPPTGIALTRQAEVNVPPGETLTLPIRIIPPSRSLVGFGKRTYHFTLTATTRAGPQTVRSVLGHLHSPPLIGPGLLTFMLLGLIALGVYLYTVIPPAEIVRRVVELEQEQVETPLDIPIVVPNPASNPEANIGLVITYEQMFQEIASRYGLDWQLVARLAYRESRLNPTVVGRDNDMGLMQIIPTTWNEWAPRVGASDPFDPYSNVTVGAAYLAFLRDHFQRRGHAEPHWMLVAYNWGPYNLELLLDNNGAWADIPEPQRRYALEILQSSPDPTFGWEEVQAELVLKTSLRR